MKEIKVKDLIKILEEHNPEANIDVIVHNYPKEFSISIGGSDGCTKESCDCVSFYVDSMCDNESE